MRTFSNAHLIFPGMPSSTESNCQPGRKVSSLRCGTSTMSMYPSQIHPRPSWIILKLSLLEWTSLVRPTASVMDRVDAKDPIRHSPRWTLVLVSGIVAPLWTLWRGNSRADQQSSSNHSRMTPWTLLATYTRISRETIMFWKGSSHKGS